MQLTVNYSPDMLPLSDSSDLFDSPHAWLTSPDLAFSSWISCQPLADTGHPPALSTQRVRISMWRKFVRYLDLAGVNLEMCAAAHVSGFLVHAGLEKEQGWRYVKLIERVFVHLNSLGINSTNPARSAAKQGLDIRTNAPKRFLDKEEKQRLLKLLAAAARDGEAAWKENKIKKKGKKEYETLIAGMRDVAVCAVLVGAGTTVSELRRLTVNCTSEPGEILVPRSRAILERRIVMDEVCADVLRVWLLYRHAHPELGDVLFPAVVNKRRDDQRTRTSAMHPSTVFRRTQALLEQIGITQARSCGQTLRNTFAASLIESGADNQSIIEAMGYDQESVFTVQRLRHDHARFFGRTAAQDEHKG